MLPFIGRSVFPAPRLAAVVRAGLSLTSRALISRNCPVYESTRIIKFGLGNIGREIRRPQLEIGPSRMKRYGYRYRGCRPPIVRATSINLSQIDDGSIIFTVGL